MVRAYIDRIKAVQPIINAVTDERFDEALNEARQLDERLKSIRERRNGPASNGNVNYNDNKDKDQISDNIPYDNDQDRLLWQSPLAGVPISVKESIGVKGLKQTCGLWARRDCIAQEDSVVVENARKLGIIPIVATNVPEMTLYWADCLVSKLHVRCKQYIYSLLVLILI